MTDTLHAEVAGEIGELEGPLEYLFGRIVGVAVSDDGVTYVADAIGSTVRAYDDHGRYLASIGSEGDGPGEFRYLLGLDVDDDGNLVVRGLFRISVFAESAVSGVADSLIRVVPVEAARTDSDIQTRAVGSEYFGPSFYWEGFERHGYFYIVYDASGGVIDTIHVPQFHDPESTGLANYPISEQGGANVVGINRAPFEPRPSWDLTKHGTVVFTAGDRYEVIEVGRDGDTVRVLRITTPSPDVPHQERVDSARAFALRMDSVPVSLDRVRGMSPMARRRELPATLPSITGLHVGKNGNLWVRRWPRAGLDETIFDVFAANWDPVATVIVPVSLKSVPAPWFTGDRITGVISDRLTDVHRVVVLRASLPTPIDG